MARPDRSAEIEAALLKAVAEHPRDLVGVVAAQLGLSRQRITLQVRNLVTADYLRKCGSTRPIYTLGPNRRLTRNFPLVGLSEDVVWFGHLLPLLGGLSRNLLDIAQHGVTEMVNNVIDHAEATRLQVGMDLRDGNLRLQIADDGVGIFRKIARALHLPDERMALLELSKGKFTTDPRRHTGEGVFFTSRMFDNFRIISGGLVFGHDVDRLDTLVADGEVPDHGTTLLMAIQTSVTRTPREVFEAYSSGPDDYGFVKTVVPVRLVQIGDESLVSRSQAKRLLQRVERFRHVVLDFTGIHSIGQAFADEIFRVFAQANPAVELIPAHAEPEVQQMIRRAEVARDADDGRSPST